MKPTLTKPFTGNLDFSKVESRTGKPVTEEDKIRITCLWAGQRGHEKCGWCKTCGGPRWVERDLEVFNVRMGTVKLEKCPHLVKDIWRNDA